MNIQKKRTRLAYLLRHDDKYQYRINAWREVSDLINNHGFTFNMINELVTSDSKQRYEFSNDMKLVRALYGHSVNVDLGFESAFPPPILYHGTSTDKLEIILSNGLSPQRRIYVHLATDTETATKVGQRHGQPVVLIIDAKAMADKGFLFYFTNNGVWLTDNVPPEYISVNSYN